MAKKRFVFIDGELNGGGAERVLLDILRNFDYQRFQVDLLQINGGGILIDDVPKDVRIIEVWHGYPLCYRFALRFSIWFGCHFLLRYCILNVVGDRHYDVAISFLEGMPTKMHSLVTNIAYRNYSWIHVDLDSFRYESSLFRGQEELLAYNRMNGVVCVAEDTANAFMKRFPSCQTPVRVVYNPIDTKKIALESEEYKVDNEVFTICCVGRLSAQKMPIRVISLARRIKDVGLKMKIQMIGDGDLREELEVKSMEYGVAGIVEFMGFQRNPFPYIKAADMLLSTSGFEGFSLVICEAMALGIPVVATKTSGPMEILDNDKYGLLCEHDDESIYLAVKRMYENPKLRKYYSKVGRERVKDFSVERTLEELYAL